MELKNRKLSDDVFEEIREDVLTQWPTGKDVDFNEAVEYQNVAEAVLYCKQKGVGAYQGGTCNETDRSAQVCTHIAMATKPDQILAKPGMGVDEGFMIVYNEMQRILAFRKRMRNK